MTTHDSLIVTGLVATAPRRITTREGLDIVWFRLASNHPRYRRSEQKWVDGDTNWYTVTGYRQLARNVYASVNKGDRVIVAGTLRLREWISDARSGIAVEIDADTIGHDLTRGTAIYSRTHSATTEQPEAETETASPAPEPAQA